MIRHGKIVGTVLAVAIVAGGAYYLFHQAPPPAPIETGRPAAKDGSPSGAPPAGKEISPEKSPGIAPPPFLRESDDWFRRKIQGLSPYARMAEWLKFDNLIRRITAAVDNIAEGKSPRAHLPFLAPGQPFTVTKNREDVSLNPQSYGRYDFVADAFASLNVEKAARTFDELKPIFQEAYRELGYPDRDFQKTLVRAIQELLRVPVVEEDIALEEEVVTFGMVDGDLQTLSAAQKHLLRMGPRNVRKIQNKLRQIALALGVPQDRLAKSM
jgi:hypothetical protein